MEKENIGFNRELRSTLMKKQIFMVVLMLLAVTLVGCTNQYDFSNINKKSEMNNTEDVTSKEESEITEEMLAEGMDLSSYEQIPDNAIQEFWSWSDGRNYIRKTKEWFFLSCL